MIVSGRIGIAGCDETSKAALLAILSDPGVAQPYFASGRQACTNARVAQWAASAGTDVFAVRDNGSGSVIGCVQLVESHLSYFVAPARWGQGYGSEMVAAFLEQLPEVRERDALYTTVVRENLASRRILEKCGFAFAGMFLARSASREPARSLLEYVYKRPAAAGVNQRGLA